MTKTVKHETLWRVADTEYARKNYPQLIGKLYLSTTVPKDVTIEPVRDSG
jgi:hypothetical protein